MPQVIWSKLALEDLQTHYRFLALKNPDAANQAVAKIQASVRILKDYPEIGRAIPSLNAAYREWIINFGSGGYIARYRYDGEVATIVAIRHQRERSF